MEYALLIYEPPTEYAKREDPAEAPAYRGRYMAYVQALRDAGVFVAGAGLRPPEAATVLRLRDGRRLVQDGPYADTKEALGGFVLIDVPGLDTALDWAARCPVAPFGTVEVRPRLPREG